MARAYSCDRCGDLFKSSEYDERVSVIMENGTPFRVGFGNTQVYISLCPKCRASFQKWWDTDAVHKTTDPDHPRLVDTLYEEDE